MKLPTVKLRRRNARGETETLIVNATEYGRNIAHYARKGWKATSYRGGDAPDDVVDFMRRQDEKELARTQVEGHAASGDKQRNYEHRQGRPNIVTAPETAASAPTVTDLAPGASPSTDTVIKPAIDPDWRKMRWFEKRAYVEAITGTKPTNAKHADELMAQFETE